MCEREGRKEKEEKRRKENEERHKRKGGKHFDVIFGTLGLTLTLSGSKLQPQIEERMFLVQFGERAKERET